MGGEQCRTAPNWVKDGYRFKETEILRECSVPIRLLAHRFVSDYAFGHINFWSAEGRHRGIVIVFCQRSGVLFKLLYASQRVIVARK